MGVEVSPAMWLACQCGTLPPVLLISIRTASTVEKIQVGPFLMIILQGVGPVSCAKWVPSI